MGFGWQRDWVANLIPATTELRLLKNHLLELTLGPLKKLQRRSILSPEFLTGVLVRVLIIIGNGVAG